MKDPYTLAAEILQNEIETQTRIQEFSSIDLYGNLRSYGQMKR